MTEILGTISSLSILVFAVSSMLAAGFSFTLREIVAPLRDPNRVGRALLGNFVLVPLLAAGIVHAFSLDAALELGFILLGTAAGAPFLMKLVAIAKGDIALGTALLVLLVAMTVVFMPIAVPVLAPDVAVDPAAVAVPLALTLLLPLVIGLLVTELARSWAKRLQPIARGVSTVTLVLVLATTLLVNLQGLVDILASPAVLAILLFVLGSFVIGFLIASPHPERRVVLGLGTAQRNIAAATVVAAEGFRGPDTLVLVVVASVLGLMLLIPMARWVRGWSRRTSSAPPGSELAGASA
jgi:BASS family bile acid:Na+ symporter